MLMSSQQFKKRSPAIPAVGDKILWQRLNLLYGRINRPGYSEATIVFVVNSL